MRTALAPLVLALSLALWPGVSGAESPPPPPPLETSADAEVTAANRLYEAGRFSDAIARYHVALSARPQLPEGWLNLGLAQLAAAQAEGYRHRARLEAAIAAFERVVALRPADHRARDLLVTAYFDGQRYATLLRLLEPEAAARPKDAELATMMARIYTQMGDEYRAIPWAERAEKLITDPEEKADAKYNLGVLHWRAVRHHREVAAERRMATTKRGIEILLELDALRKGAHAGTLSYLDLLHRERAALQKTARAREADLATARSYRTRSRQAAGYHDGE
jgi:tetratricopeptide (TPR) repeat protein